MSRRAVSPFAIRPGGKSSGVRIGPSLKSTGSCSMALSQLADVARPGGGDQARIAALSTPSIRFPRLVACLQRVAETVPRGCLRGGLATARQVDRPSTFSP